VRYGHSLSFGNVQFTLHFRHLLFKVVRTNSVTYMVAAVGNAKSFSSGRHLAAWLGLVPRQRSSGGKERLLGLSKRGDGYLRRQLMHGARAMVRISPGREGKLWSWIKGLLGRRAFNVVVAAVANKLARILWALLSRGETYRATA